MLPRRAVVVVLLLAGSITLPAGQQPASSSSSQRIASGVAAVVVDAVVRDGKGNPVTDLRKEDFELLEDGVPQEIGDVTIVMPGQAPNRKGNAVAIDSNAAGSADAVANDARQAGPGFLAIVFDRLTPEARALAYKGALACLDTLQPGDFVGVFVADLRLTTIQPYTNDRNKLRAAIGDVASRATSTFDRASTRNDLQRDPRGNALPGDADPSVPVVASPESVGRPVDGREGLLAREVMAIQNDAWGIMARDQQGYATTSALLAIYPNMGEPVRKSTQKTLPVYARIAPASGTVPTATIEVVREGTVLEQFPAPLAVVDAPGRLRYLMEMPLDAFAAGRYILRLIVTQGERREVREATLHLIE